MENQKFTFQAYGVTQTIGSIGNVTANDGNIELLSSLKLSSVGLYSWRSQIAGKHIERDEVGEIIAWIGEKAERQSDRIALVVGNAGMGKSVIMEDVLKKLYEENIPVMGIKLDQLNFHSSQELNQEVAFGGGIPIVKVFQELNTHYEQSVLLIDQIDALSMSLSTDRTAMNAANQLIQQIQTLQNVKIIISCRQFDLDYDYTLQEYRIYKEFYIHELNDNQLDEVLEVLKVSPKLVCGHIRDFLKTPINLYLFSIVGNPNMLNNEVLTLQQLYDELWKKDILTSSENEKLNECLSQIVNKMYEEQTLTISKRIFENKYVNEIATLLSEHFMVENSEGIQFLHQSLFDYTYARKFIDSGNSLIDDLTKEHQGLFVRSRVRQVILYMREISTSNYLSTLDKILFDENFDGTPVIRFHIKSLVINSLGLCTNIDDREKKYFLNKVLKDTTFAEIFINSVYSDEWFNIIAYESYQGQLVKQGNEEVLQQIMSMCYNNINRNEDMVIDYLNILADQSNQKINSAIFNLICNIGRYSQKGDSIIKLFKRVKPEISLPKASTFLRFAVNYDAEFVSSELAKRVNDQIEEDKDKTKISFKHDYDDEEVFDSLTKKNAQSAFKFAVTALHRIFDKTRFKYEEDDVLYSSWDFFSYCRGDSLYSLSPSGLLDYVLSYIETTSRNKDINTINDLKEKARSERNIDLLIAVAGFTANPSLFKREIYGILTDIKYLSSVIDHDSVLDFYIKKMFKASFILYTKNEQNNILKALCNLHPSWETMILKDHNRYGGPLTRKGKSFGEFIQFLGNDIEIVRKNFPTIYKEYQKVKEKYKYLDTNEPNKMEVHSGWVGVKESAYDNMTDDQWLNLMRKYNDNSFDHDFKKPTMTGVAMQFESKIKSDPKRFIKVINRINGDNSINIGYLFYGFDGLTETDKPIEIENVYEVFKMIVSHFGGDVNKYGSGRLCSFLRNLRYFINKENLPQDVFDFICKALKETKEDKDANNENDKEPYQTGINRARGVAGELLVDCSLLGDQYKERIFETLESVASTASITTRAAILLNMARLNTLDTERSLDLYLLLLHDYQPTLLAMPLHNLNPLVYYINYGFDRLIPLFKEAIKRPVCHKTITEILWIAFVKNIEGAESLLQEIIKESDLAAISFFQTVEQFAKNFPLSKSMKFLKELLNSDNSEVKKQANIIYNGYKNWSDEDMEQFADTFVDSKCCAYISHSYFKFLDSFAKKSPSKTLKWIIATYDAIKENKDEPDEVFGIQRILEVLTQSYNGVRKYNLDDELLEKAMNVVDELLADSKMRIYLKRFLTELDNK
jgi:hypothetical protein